MSRLDPTQGQMSHTTNILQVYCQDPEDAPRQIATKNGQGIALLVLVDMQNCCPVLKLNMPTGTINLETVFGQHNGIIDDGCYCCYPCWRRVEVMISRNTIRFNAPVYNVPTKDNVLVTIDCGVNFHIGEKPETFEADAKKFFYNFGPNRLQELLQEEVDEGIRSFIKNIKVYRVRDVKTEMTTQIKHELEEKFRSYGVIIEQVNIMKVFLPTELRYCFSATTTFDVVLQQQVRYKEHRLLQLRNNEEKTMLSLKRDNKAKLVTLEHEKNIAVIEQLKAQVENETSLQTQIINAESRRAVAMIQANNILKMAELTAKAKATKVLKQAEAHKLDKEEQADNLAQIIRDNAATRLEAARDQTQALIIENQAESKYSSAQEGSRRHDEKIALAESMVRMAEKGKFVVSDQSQSTGVLDFYHNTMEVIQKR